MSDALGTATEMRATKNYPARGCHELNPGLGTWLVSRQETREAA